MIMAILFSHDFFFFYVLLFIKTCKWTCLD